MPPSPPPVAIPGPCWHIESRKYDQRLHYTLPAYLMNDDGACLWFRTRVGDILQHHTRDWARPMQTYSDFFFWRERWYNIFRNHTLTGIFSYYYCNIGLPPMITNSTLTFVDLDLDVAIWPGRGYEVLDVDEFRAHTIQYNYPPDVQREAYKAVANVLFRWHKRQPPFDQNSGDITPEGQQHAR